MKFQLREDWPILGDTTWIVPAGTIIDSGSDEVWSIRARGLTPPISAKVLDAEAHEALLRAFPDHRHLLGGAWEDK